MSGMSNRNLAVVHTRAFSVTAYVGLAAVIFVVAYVVLLAGRWTDGTATTTVVLWAAQISAGLAVAAAAVVVWSRLELDRSEKATQSRP